MYAAYPEKSIFYGREIEERINVEWGSHQLAEATRNMINKALEEPRNKRLILLSESEIPLYPPQAVHHQLLSESKSRLDSCGCRVSSKSLTPSP